jgi:diacylglycerol kinase family enzyme
VEGIMKYILFNPKAKNGNTLEHIKKQYLTMTDVKTISVLDKEDYENCINSLTEEDTIILIGGDGTLNRFINDIKDKNVKGKILFNTAGTGNDFYTDVKEKEDGDLIEINKYINNLPKAIINGKEYLFINGIGFGIDGYCCEEGDRLQAKSDKPVNYTAIAIKGLLFKYKAPRGKVTVDGVTKEYKRIWLAPTMKGRYYGGGMMVTPEQNRLSDDKLVSSVVWHKSSKLKTLMIFPSIFKGEHVKHTKFIEIVKGHHIIVEFDRPTALQIDGETVSGVTKYEVIA